MFGLMGGLHLEEGEIFLNIYTGAVCWLESVGLEQLVDAGEGDKLDPDNASSFTGVTRHSSCGQLSSHYIAKWSAEQS